MNAQQNGNSGAVWGMGSTGDHHRRGRDCLSPCARRGPCPQPSVRASHTAVADRADSNPGAENWAIGSRPQESAGLGILPPVTMPDDNPNELGKGRAGEDPVLRPSSFRQRICRLFDLPPAECRLGRRQRTVARVSGNAPLAKLADHHQHRHTRRSCSGAARRLAWRHRRSRPGRETSPATWTRSWLRRP